MDELQKQIDQLRAERASTQKRIKDLLLAEDPANDIFFHEEIFRLQQDSLRMEREIQILQARLRRLTFC
jgi:hypothetical protein